MNLKQIKQHVTISDENSKTGAIPSVSLPPIKSCNNKMPCTKGDCYVLKNYYKRYPSCQQAYEKNLLCAKNLRLYFKCIDEWLFIRKPDFFRFHVSGDILNLKYYQGMAKIALKHKTTKFLAFTKRYNLTKNFETNRPKNLTIVISSWPGIQLPKTSLPIAFMDDGTETRINNAVECPGNCENCGMCWQLPKLNKNVVFKKH